MQLLKAPCSIPTVWNNAQLVTKHMSAPGTYACDGIQGLALHGNADGSETLNMMITQTGGGRQVVVEEGAQLSVAFEVKKVAAVDTPRHSDGFGLSAFAH